MLFGREAKVDWAKSEDETELESNLVTSNVSFS